MVDALAKIMIVDDEDDILEFLSYNLRNEQYDVKTVRDGKNAVKVAKNFEPDLILLDIMMPELDGVEVCRMLREEKQFDSTIIAFLTARNEDFTLIAALDAGGDDFITKPVKTRVLISRIRALLRRPGRVPKEEQNSVLGDKFIKTVKGIGYKFEF